MKLKIKVTKEILEKTKNARMYDAKSCAIAVALRDIFPYASVAPLNFTIEQFETGPHIKLPREATEFISIFDSCHGTARLLLPEFEFEIEIPEEIINSINIDELRPLLTNHRNLEIVS